MYVDAEERKKELMAKNKMDGLMFKMDADPRIIGSGPDGTRKGLGYYLRHLSIDEFPNFWSILKGDMSLVGTRHQQWMNTISTNCITRVVWQQNRDLQECGR